MMKLYLVNGASIISEDMCKTDYLLQTFFNISKKDTNLMNRFISMKGQENFILDSGAFSLFNGTGKKLNYEVLKKYVDEYCDFINKYDINQFVEMDIDMIIGYDKVKKINEYIKNRTGKKPIYVYHQETRELDDLLKTLETDNYIFWGGISKSGVKSKTIAQGVISEAFKYGTKIHMLGYTPPDLDILKYLYSCDSSSWTMGGRSGVLFNFNGDKLETIKLKDKKRNVFVAINNHNFNQWIKYQQYLKNKGWITN